ncbi:hypothetical protein [Alicyclobacillus sp. SO9]|uniref:hypothetical protein n=1 Tax=Alicyclobacillus sp. SO9 TaxID=2665646 RepID=UPI0018E6F300|nr:hypothetical protein [Alicyclobacillus sp. SO9]
MGAVFLSSALVFYLTLWQGYTGSDRHVQTLIMGISLRRSLTQDIHAASKVGMGRTSFTLWVNGDTYRYYVNSNGQCVRVRIGGGTTVLADGVRTLTAEDRGRVLQITVHFRNGYDEMIQASRLYVTKQDKLHKTSRALNKTVDALRQVS